MIASMRLMFLRLRPQQRRYLLLFSCCFIVLLVISIYHAIVSPATYSLPSSHRNQPLWQNAQKEWKEGRKKGGKEWNGNLLCSADGGRPTETKLTMNEDGSFRIAIFTDLHFSCGHSCDLDHQSQLLMDSILEMERPDFIVFNGDLVQSEGGYEKPNIFMDIFAPAERRGIPFAVIFGNHDSDGPVSLSRDALVQLANKCPHSVTMSTKEYFRNDGNYIRVLKGNSTVTHLLFLETNRDSMTISQVNWLREEMDSIQPSAGNIMSTLPSLMHFDIPAKEFIMGMCSKNSVCNGIYGERAEYGGKELNTGFYDVFQTFEGQVRAIFSGHDHKNDLCSVAPSDDTTEVLCYARASGYGGYGHDMLIKGSRIIHINERMNTIMTYVVNGIGERGQILHFIQNET